MPIEDIFSIQGRGTVVTESDRAWISAKWARVGDRQLSGHAEDGVVTGVEMFKKLLDEGQASGITSDRCRAIKKDDVERRQVI